MGQQRFIFPIIKICFLLCMDCKVSSAHSSWHNNNCICATITATEYTEFGFELYCGGCDALRRPFILDKTNHRQVSRCQL